MIDDNKKATKAIIDLSAIKYNINVVKNVISPQCKILLPIKADAYGHGAVEVAKMASGENISMFGVATLDEALALRNSGITIPILILNRPFADEMKNIIEHSITPTVFLYEDAKKINDTAKRMSLNKKVAVHFKIDTGMSRNGCEWEKACKEALKIQSLPYIFLEGIYTHFPCADEKNKEFTYIQIKRFIQIKEELINKGVNIPIWHAANSAAILDIPSAHFNMVRPGIMIYGYLPSKEIHNKKDLKPALTFKTKISFVKKVSEGTPIGYNHTYRTKNETTICTLAVGYADGLNRRLSNVGRVIIDGKFFPIAGNICMDQCLIDVGNHPVKAGQDVLLIGNANGSQNGNSAKIWADDMALMLGTIPYEITCQIGNNVNRYYTGG